MERLNTKIEADRRPFREKVNELVEHIEAAEQRARLRLAERGLSESWESLQATFEIGRPEALPIPTRPPRDLSALERQLRKASDMAARIFDAQLLIVQPRD
jgi:hypothetical protein